MKNLIIICSLLSIFSCENKTLTENDIQKLLDSSKVYNEYTLKKNFKIENIIDKLNSKVINNTILKENFHPYYISDFNKDGYKDYLVNLDLKPKKDSSTILFRPIDEYKNFVILLSKNRKEFDLVNFDNKRVYYYIIGTKINSPESFEIMTIKSRILEKDGYNIFEKIDFKIKDKKICEISKNKNLFITKIVLKDIGGWSGENYTIQLKKDSIVLNSKNFSDLEGTFSEKNIEEFEKFSKYLNEIGFTDLKDKYIRNCADCDSKEITIFYGKNSKKTIYDYGKSASLNLTRFYENIDDFMKKAKWEKK